MSESIVRISTQQTWEPESLNLKLSFENYTSRQQMADMLRRMAHWVDEGITFPFDFPIEDVTYRGKWDEDAKEWRVYRVEEGDDDE